jgi:hypothetical protein
MPAEIVTLATEAAALLNAYAWGESVRVARTWLDVADLKSLSTLTVLVMPDSAVASSYTARKFKNELSLQVVIQKRIGANATTETIDALVAKVEAVRDLLRQDLAGAGPLPNEWPVIADPEKLHEHGLFFSVLVLRWLKP